MVQNDRRHGIASAHFIWPSKPSDVAIALGAIPIGAVRGLMSAGAGEQCAQPQQPDFVQHLSRVGRHRRYRSIAASTSVTSPSGPAVQQRLHQNSGRVNAPPQQLSPADQIVDGGTQERYGVIAISPPSPLTHC